MTSHAGPLLEVRGLHGPKTDPERVGPVDLTLADGGLLHVHGPSGSGKTTLLRLLARLEPRADGTMRLAGQDADTVPRTEWRRRVSLVFQGSNLFPGTVGDNVAWAARHHGFDVDVEALLEAVGLGLSPERDASGLSGGEAKRLAVARALAVRPDALLLDEPTGPLDVDNRAGMRRLVGRLRHQGLGVVMVSHLEEDLTALPGPAIMLDEGRVVATGPSEGLVRAAEAEP